MNIQAAVMNAIATLQNFVEQDRKLEKELAEKLAELEKEHKQFLGKLEKEQQTNRFVSSTKEQTEHQKIQQRVQTEQNVKIKDNNRLDELKNRTDHLWTHQFTPLPVTPTPPDFPALERELQQFFDQSISGKIYRKFHSIKTMLKTFFNHIDNGHAYLDQEIQRIATLGQQEIEAATYQKEQELLSIHLRTQEVTAKGEEILLQQIQKIQNACLQEEELLKKKLRSYLENTPIFTTLQKEIATTLPGYGAFSADWDCYDPKGTPQKDLLLGAIQLPLNLPEALKKAIPETFHKGQNFVTLPVTLSPSPLLLYGHFDEQSRELLYQGIESLLLKLYRSMPITQMEILVLDPKLRGKSLGHFNGEEKGLMGITCYNTKEEIGGLFRSLEKDTDTLVAKIGTAPDLYAYNANSPTPLPYKTLVLYNALSSLNGNDRSILAILLSNAKRCGYNIIILEEDNQVEQYRQVMTAITYTVGQKTLHPFGSNTPIPLLLDTPPQQSKRYIEEILTHCKTGLQVDNQFATHFPSLDVPLSSTVKKLSLPFSVNRHGQMVNLDISECHTLLSGQNRSGKSTTLHMLITSVVMHYDPRAINLWLVDYGKVEFNFYTQYTPPHVTFIGIDQSEDFSFALLRRLQQEMEQRTALFLAHKVDNITEYRQKEGEYALPNILLVIDEFHHLTQAIQNHPEYCTLLENLLSESRKFGIFYIFSDQYFSRLGGLTNKGKAQFAVRLAMRNQTEELKETLALPSSFYNDALQRQIHSLNTGDILFRQETDGKSIALDVYKTIYITKEQRITVMENARKKHPTTPPIIIDDNHSQQLDPTKIQVYEKGLSLGTDIPLYLGTPVNFNSHFHIALGNKVGENLCGIVRQEEPLRSLLYHSIYSFLRQENRRVALVIAEDSTLYPMIEPLLPTLAQLPNLHYYIGMDEINELFAYLNTEKVQDLLVVYVGLENILKHYTLSSSRSNIPTLDEIGAFGGEKPIVNYSVDNLLELFTNRDKGHVHHLALFATPKDYHRIRAIPKDLFNHFLLGQMSHQDALGIVAMEVARKVSNLGKNSVLYTDGYDSEKFHPFAMGN